MKISPKNPELSIIIPTLNEEKHLPRLLRDLNEQQGIEYEVLIGDGGSTDQTLSIALKAGVRVIFSPRGRGVQMNRAVPHARGRLLLFLHADSQLPDPELLARCTHCYQQLAAQTERFAGHFQLRFLRSTHGFSPTYAYMEAKTTLNRINTTNGDQGLLLSLQFFTELGGFDESLPFLEDQRIAEKIRSQGRLITLPGTLLTSARRFESEGLHRRYLLMGMIMGLFSTGTVEFFHQAPQVYRIQEETGRLLLWPYFQLLWQLCLRSWGLGGTLRLFFHLGQYLCENAWQPFFFFDVLLSHWFAIRQRLLLKGYDRYLAPLLRLPFFFPLFGLLCFLLFMVLFPLYFLLMESLKDRIRRNKL